MADYSEQLGFLSAEKQRLLEILMGEEGIDISDLEKAFIAPRNWMERQLADIWAEVLDVGRVGVDENFFELGGDSIYSIRLQAKAQARGIFFSVQQLFEHPTIEQLAQVASQQAACEAGSSLAAFSLLSQADREKLPAQVEDAYPLTRLQLGMLFHNEYSTQASLYHNVTSYHVEAPLEVQKLREALALLVRRHPMLRTSFNLTDYSQPLQLVYQTAEVSLYEERIEHLLFEEQEALLKNWFYTVRLQKIDWTRAPLVRFFVHYRNQKTFQFSVVEHHAILDGWSVASLLTELFQLYSSLLDGFSPVLDLPPSDVFKKFVAMEQEVIASEEVKRFWAEYIQGSTFTRLPRQLQQSGETDHAIGMHRVPLPSLLSQDIQQLARSLQIPLKHILLAVHSHVMSVFGGSPDVTTGLVVNGRPEEIDGERATGLFLNTLPFRLKLAGGSWRELIGQVFATEQRLLPYRRYPLAEIQQLQGGQPLFETAFNFVHFHVYQDILQSERLKVLDVYFSDETNFALSANFSLNPLTSEVELALLYDVHELSTEQVSLIGDQYIRTLFAAVHELAADYRLQPTVPEAERAKILLEWNATDKDIPAGLCLHHLFEAQVKQTPDASALYCEGTQYSYRELNRRANSLAHRLRASHIGPEMAVGVLLDRSSEAIIAVLGILKAGGAYVPLDPDHPSTRLAFILEDTQMSVIVTRQHLQERVPKQGLQVICIDELEKLPEDVEENLELCIDPDNLAYIIYTSGSSGKPKGVLISHWNAVNSTLARADYYQQAVTKFLLLSPIAFDSSVAGIFWTLSQGGELILPPAQGERDIVQVAQIIDTHGISHILSLPSLYSLLLTHAQADHLLSLRCVIVAGEPCPVSLVDKHFALLPRAALYNEYGPTEGSVWSTVYRCTPHWSGSSIPIGKPVMNVQTYILDAHGQISPPGVIGELYISGSGLARGYLNNLELTVEKFVPCPFSDTPGARMYKTGDLACYLPTGDIEFIGRVDQQVKVRGFRIELGEVEAALLQHPDIREAAVVVRADSMGSKYLVAYGVPANDTLPTDSDLRAFLHTLLPDYMVPSMFVTLESLPLTSNGKVDRGLLLKRSVRETEVNKKVVMPRNATEEKLAHIWSGILGIERVGIYNDFFSLGGHSLLAIQIISRVREAFQLDVPIRVLFDSPTIAGLGEQIETLRHDRSSSYTAIPPIPRECALPLSYSQQGLWFVSQLDPESRAYDIGYEVRLFGPLHKEAMQQAFNDIVDRHEALRSSFVLIDGRPYTAIAPPQARTLPLIDLSDLPKDVREAQAQRIIAEQEPFDLEHGPLFRPILIKLSEEEHIALVRVHHSVFDAWSMVLLLEEFSKIYTAFVQNLPSPFEKLPIQYVDFAHWQHQWLQSEAIETDLAYWRQKLSGIPPFLNLPTDRPRPAIRTDKGTIENFVMADELYEPIKAISRQEGVTLFMTMLAIYYILLYRYTGQCDLCVGTPSANRNRIELEGVIGFFINSLVLRVQLSPDMSFRQVVKQVREVILEAQEHQDIPFGRLVEELDPPRNPGYTPLFQTMFAFLQDIPAEADFANLHADFQKVKQGAAFDLTFNVEDTGRSLSWEIEYSADLFDDATIVRLVGHVQTLIAAIIANPDQSIARLPLLTDAERHQLLVEWNQTYSQYPAPSCIHELFEAQVERSPDAVAVMMEGEHLTYQELNTRANQLAHRLQKVGVGPEVLVGLCVERSIEMVIGLLGILKAGGAYVPLDPAYPQERLEFMLQDSHASVLLAQQGLPLLPSARGMQTFYLDQGWQEFAEEPITNIGKTASAANLAYVIYTSGSTGQPKGVAIEHRSLVNHCHAIARHYQLRPSDRVVQFASISFDAAAEEIYPTWISGATVVLRPREFAISIDDWHRWLELMEISVLDLPTAYWHHWVTDLTQHSRPLPRCLRLVIVGGEQALPDLYARWRQYAGNQIQWSNTYGPTECTVTAVLYGPTTGDPQQMHMEKLPIGRPIANTRCYVLDQYLQPVPIGVVGELYIGGVGLARGYLHRGGLTAERFIDHPYAQTDGERLYRTGDLVRYLPDDNIVYVGRSDQQVKIRGYRIELSEITMAISQHPAIQACAVVPHEDEPGNKRLVAYLVVDKLRSFSVQELRTFLQQSLPDYMIPASFMQLESLPVMANGKLDQQRLSTLSGTPLKNAQEYVAPSTANERLIAAIWQEVLHVEKVGLHDNFFDLGGHSLLMIQVHSKLREALQLELSLVEMFMYPTIQSLVSHLKHGPEQDVSSTKIARRSQMRREAIEQQRQLRQQRHHTRERM